ncbi:putative prophage lysis protein [Escherichia coli]|uniref:Putative prophage lysis protein n=1 Tax=Escherichia coli TaxID=562 RepID=A0A376VJV2_ECOLX|nr:putative prophage lysis protein [Escherichia coli]
MDQMEKITTGVSYTTSAVGTGYWFLQLLEQGFPVSVGGNRRAGESAVWAADISD